MNEAITLNATRMGAEARVKAFVPQMGDRYTNNRNFDRGPGAHRDVSGLSPYIRRRLVLESDVVAEAISAHGFESSEKFVQEIMWRGYFKGWLENRPSIWVSYRQELKRDLQALDRDERLHDAVDRAETGTTGLECFDAWANELMETGYLHNHARMWFASIWIFTLGLPWRIGADYFYRHLLDGDPASNTLSWRWVAGLHTRGKNYKAKTFNIAQFTSLRFTPSDEELSGNIDGLVDEEPEGLPFVEALRSPHSPKPGIQTALLITEEDCRVEDFNFKSLHLCSVATLAASHLRSLRPIANNVVQFEARALADAAARVGALTGSIPAAVALHANGTEDLATWAASRGAIQIVTPYVPQGPLRDWLNEAEPVLAKHGVRFCEWQRDWDKAIWPHATAGFFKIKQRIPAIVRELCNVD